MRRIFLLLGWPLLASSHASLAQTKCVDLIAANRDYVRIDHVTIVDQRVIITKSGDFENAFLELTFEVQTSGGPDEKVAAMEITSGQASLDYDLNPSEFFVHARREPTSGGHLTVLKPTETVRFKFISFLDQRVRADNPRMWRWKQETFHFNFDAGMIMGFDRWHLYRLNITSPMNLKFEFVKTYALSQGRIIE